jgi:hypothetical protein
MGSVKPLGLEMLAGGFFVHDIEQLIPNNVWSDQRREDLRDSCLLGLASVDDPQDERNGICPVGTAKIQDDVNQHHPYGIRFSFSASVSLFVVAGNLSLPTMLEGGTLEGTFSSSKLISCTASQVQSSSSKLGCCFSDIRNGDAFTGDALSSASSIMVVSA